MKILVTGSSGFIGKHLCRLLALKHEVTGVDLRHNPDASYEQIIGDLSDQHFIETLPDTDYVIHLSAYNKTHAFYTVPYTVIENSLQPTLNMIARYQNCQKFIYSSSSEVYAGGVNLGITKMPVDTSAPLVIDDVRNPRWSYAASKMMGEVALIAANKQFGTPYLIIRYHNVYGAGQTDHFIPEYYVRVMRGDTDLPGAHQTRSFTYVKDAVNITERAISEFTNETVHIINPKEIVILEAAKVINKICGITQQPIPKPPPAGSVERRAAVGIFPEYDYTDLQTGIAETIASLR